MINQINEKIYNYIFSTNIEMKNNRELNVQKLEQKLDKIISENYDIIADFWDENMYDFNSNCVIKTQTLEMKNPVYIYRNFPRMNSNTKLDFLEYKANQIKKEIMDNGDFIKDNIIRPWK